MIKGLGLDLCETARMEKLLQEERFLQRYFSETEAAYIRSRGTGAPQTMAGIFAAKEAFSKALGTGIAFSLQEVCVVHDEQGQPGYELTGEAKKLGGEDRFFLSISHDGGMAAAVCVRESKE